MASGDVTISIAVEGGVTKSVALDSATRQKVKAYVDSSSDADLSADADWQVHAINKWASTLVAEANNQLEREASYTPKTFTAAS